MGDWHVEPSRPKTFESPVLTQPDRIQFSATSETLQFGVRPCAGSFLLWFWWCMRRGRARA
jgi:hypothetical protein